MKNDRSAAVAGFLGVHCLTPHFGQISASFEIPAPQLRQKTSFFILVTSVVFTTATCPSAIFPSSICKKYAIFTHFI
jgi:hypothetical protein